MDRNLRLMSSGRTDAIRVTAARAWAAKLDQRAMPLAVALRSLFARLAQREVRLAVNAVASQFRKTNSTAKGLSLGLRKEFDAEDTARLIEVIRTFGVRRINGTASEVALANNSEWETKPQIVSEFLESKTVHLQNLMEDAREEFERIINDMVADSLAAEPRGTIAQLSRALFQRLTETRGPFSPERAMLIARTETAQAENFGIQQGLRVAGIQAIKWVAITDDRVRDTHRAMHGKTRRLDGDLFKLPSGVKMRYPADPEAKGPRKAVASEVINCRCVQVPHLEK